MFVNQHVLGEFKTHKPSSFTQLIPGQVVSVVDYDEFQQVEVAFSEGGTTIPVWVVEDGVSPKPVNGDWVLVGFIGGHKNQPYIAGYYRGKYAWSNHIMMRRDETTAEILIQLPTLTTDLEEHLTDDTKKETRTYIRLSHEGFEINHPQSDSVRTSIKIDNAGNITIDTPGAISLATEGTALVNAQNANLNTSGTASVSADSVTVTGTNSLSLSSSDGNITMATPMGSITMSTKDGSFEF